MVQGLNDHSMLGVQPAANACKKIQIYLFHCSLYAVVPGQPMPDPMFPDGFIDAPVFVDVLALTEWNVIFKFSIIHVAVYESAEVNQCLPNKLFYFKGCHSFGIQSLLFNLNALVVLGSQLGSPIHNKLRSKIREESVQVENVA